MIWITEKNFAIQTIFFPKGGAQYIYNNFKVFLS